MTTSSWQLESFVSSNSHSLSSYERKGLHRSDPTHVQKTDTVSEAEAVVADDVEAHECNAM